MSATEANSRYAVLDIMRGVGIMGILFANIVAFAYPTLAPKLIEPMAWKGIDWTIEQWTTALVSGKFRGLLCILFGVGLWLQYQSRMKRDETRAASMTAPPVIGAKKEWPHGYMRRMGWLFGIGCIHGLFFWFGDILSLYALTALCFVFVVRYETKTLWRVVFSLSVIAFIFGVSLAATTGTTMGSDAFKDSPFIEQYLRGEAQAFASGSYVQQLGYRAVLFGLMLASAIILVPMMGMLFTLGIIFARERLLTHPTENLPLLKRVMLVSFGVGIPLNGAAFFMQDSVTIMRLQSFLEFFGAAFLSVGYLTLIALACSRAGVQRFLRAVQNVGRMALTCYLSQTLICVFVYYSFGFAQFGQHTRPETLSVVAGVLAFNLVFASVWLRFFTMGPVEAWWRSRSEGRPFHMPKVAR